MNLQTAYELALQIEATPGWRLHWLHRDYRQPKHGNPDGWMLSISKRGRSTWYTIRTPADWERVYRARELQEWERGVLAEVETLLRESAE